MSLFDLRKQKREWLNNTVTSSYLKRSFKLSEEEIRQIKSEVRYGKERYTINSAKIYLDAKIDKNSLIKFSGNSVTKRCNQCNKDVNSKFFSTSKSGICIKCERKNEIKTDRVLDEINTSRNRKPARDQRTLL